MSLRHDIAAWLPRMREEQLPAFCAFYEKYAPLLDGIDAALYARLPAADQPRFVQWMLKRWGKVDLVNPVERRLYDAVVERVARQERPVEALDGQDYQLLDLAPQGQAFSLLAYPWCLAVHDVYYNQYEHGEVQLAPDDVVIDAGGFIGDTAVLFHHKLGGRCHVHSFELLDENLRLMLHNLERNGVPSERVTINRMALAASTGDEIVVGAGATQGATNMFGREAGGGERVSTITLDDYVGELGLARVDFIKMDIEGAEVPALQGAQHTIRHFRPKLAICLYHLWDDLLKVPQAILATGVDYQFRFKWVQLKDGWEAVLLATPPERAQPARDATPTTPPPPATADALAGALATLTRAYTRQTGRLAASKRERAAA